MKKVWIALLVWFVLGWALRVLGPYWQGEPQERRLRREAVTRILKSLHAYAATNDGRFPPSLKDIALLDRGAAVDTENYIYKAPEVRSSNLVDRMILAEKESSFPGKPVYFVGFEWESRAAMEGKEIYHRLLVKHGLVVSNAPPSQ